MAVNIDDYDFGDMFMYGQVPITKEDYLKLESDGADLSGVVPDAQAPSHATPSAYPTDKDKTMSAYMRDLQNIMEGLYNNQQVVAKYEYNAGHDTAEVSPFSKLNFYLDENSFLGWSSYELGYISSSKAIGTQDEILNLDDFDFIGEETTSADTETFKMSLINDSLLYGDIILFDKGRRENALAGFYIGDGAFITLVPGQEDGHSDIISQRLYERMEDGNVITTPWLKEFNGNIYRSKVLNREEFVWYNSTINN